MLDYQSEQRRQYRWMQVSECENRVLEDNVKYDLAEKVKQPRLFL